MLLNQNQVLLEEGRNEARGVKNGCSVMTWCDTLGHLYVPMKMRGANTGLKQGCDPVEEDRL